MGKEGRKKKRLVEEVIREEKSKGMRMTLVEEDETEEKEKVRRVKERERLKKN